MLVRSRLRWLLSLCALSLLGLATGAAPAPAAWSGNVPLSNPLGGDAEFPALAVAPNGAALGAWRDLQENSVRYSEHAAGAAFPLNSSIAIEAPGSSAAEGRPAVALNSAGAAVIAWAAGPFGAEEVKASYRPAGKSFSAPVTISAAGENANAPDVAIDAAGKAVLVWSVGDGPAGPRFAEASVHGPSGEFSDGELVNRGEDTGYTLPMQPRVAMDGSGNAIAVFPSQRPGGEGTLIPVQRAYMAVGDTEFGAPADLPAGHAPDIAFGGDRATAVWQRDGVIYAAEQTTAGNTAFGSEKQVSADADGAASTAAVAVDGAATATVVYQAGAGDTAVFAATRSSGGSFGQPDQLSSAGDSGDATVAVTPGGAAVAAWTRFNGSKETVEASRRPAGADFGSPTTLSTGSSGPIAANLAAAGIDAAGNSTVLWQRAEFFGVVFAATYSTGVTPPDDGGGDGDDGGGGDNNGDGGGGGGGDTGGAQTPTASPVTTASAPKPAAKPLKCRRGFKKKKVGGKPKCVKKPAKAKKHKR